MPKTYAIVEINCGYTSTDIVGTGNCETIVINWDMIVDSQKETMESLKRVRMAKDNMASQSMSESQHFLESIEGRLMDVMSDFEEEVPAELISASRTFHCDCASGLCHRVACEPDDDEDEELCLDCGKQADGCACDDSGASGGTTELSSTADALSSTADTWGCDSMVTGAPHAGRKVENSDSAD